MNWRRAFVLFEKVARRGKPGGYAELDSSGHIPQSRIQPIVIAGDEGPEGPMGPPGAPGNDGATGATGSTGIPGANGAPGAAGAAGATGATGASGQSIQGEEGPEGPTGPPGLPGNDGAQGAPGVSIQGEEGPEGPTGGPGVTGATGATGQQGPMGPQGDDGNDGNPGPAGNDGAAGQPGQPIFFQAEDSSEPSSVPMVPWYDDFQLRAHATPTIGSADGVTQRLVTYQTRAPRYWLKNPSATTIISSGAIAAPTVTTQTSVSGDTATKTFLTINTAASNGSVASVVSTTAFLRRCHSFTLVQPTAAGDAASQANVRRWIGAWSADPSATGAPTTQHMAAFRYDTGVDGTAFWRCVTCDGASGVTTTTTTVAAGTAAQENVFRIETDGALGHVAFYIDDVCVALHTTNLPGNTTNLFHGWTLTNLDATVRIIKVGSTTLIHT